MLTNERSDFMTKAKKLISILLSLVISVCMLCATSSAFAASYKTVKGTYRFDYASQVLTILNEERSKNGLKPLVMTKELTDGAMIRATETTVSFSHTRPNGEQCFTAFNWNRAAGENIAYGQRSPQQVMTSWMNSSGHRANILSSNFTSVGIGCMEYNGTLYWSQAFSGGSGSSYSSNAKRAVSVDVSLTAAAQSKVTYLDSQTDSTTASKPSTTQQTTKEQTTKQQTTKQQTTKQQTTKQQTTKSTTTRNNQKTYGFSFYRWLRQFLIRF
jgi:uncharacterized protein YkwD